VAIFSVLGGIYLEVKINREIRNYTESMFFGLSLRQFVFSLLAVAVAVGLYFGLKPYVGTETVSWMCILGAAPFAAMGFITYNGMTAEQFVWAWIRSELLEPKQIKFEPVNIYYEALKSTIDAKEKEVYKSDDKEH
jgi:riboflavin transporter FmnP